MRRAVLPRCELLLSGRPFGEVVSAEVVRDIEELSGSFRAEILDVERTWSALPGWWKPGGASARGPVTPGERAEIRLDGQTALLGWLDDVEVRLGPDSLSMALSGRDVTGDLVDCAAAADGPAEFVGLTLPEIAARICAPFGISVRSEVDPGPPFPRFGIEPGETAIGAIEKACRQRAVLATSDGVGGLVLTRGGRGAAPAPLVFGDNIQTLRASFDHSGRFSEYIVKGQGERPRRAAPPALDGTAAPLTTAAPAARPEPASAAGERPRVVMSGRARDAAVARHRPLVALAKTQSGGASVQEQADWMMRTARGKAERLTVGLADWRAGPQGRLWRPNERVAVDDPLSGASAELLVAGVRHRWGDGGATAELSLCGPDAFDLLDEGGEAERRRPARPARAPLDGTARPLTPEVPRT